MAIVYPMMNSKGISATAARSTEMISKAAG
jgi:hypothetical protein